MVGELKKTNSQSNQGAALMLLIDNYNQRLKTNFGAGINDVGSKAKQLAGPDVMWPRKLESEGVPGTCLQECKEPWTRIHPTNVISRGLSVKPTKKTCSLVLFSTFPSCLFVYLRRLLHLGSSQMKPGGLADVEENRTMAEAINDRFCSLSTPAAAISVFRTLLSYLKQNDFKRLKYPIRCLCYWLSPTFIQTMSMKCCWGYYLNVRP